MGNPTHVLQLSAEGTNKLNYQSYEWNDWLLQWNLQAENNWLRSKLCRGNWKLCDEELKRWINWL